MAVDAHRSIKPRKRPAFGGPFSWAVGNCREAYTAQCTSAVQPNGRIPWCLNAVFKPDIFALAGFHGDVPFDTPRVFVQLSAAEAFCFDLDILVVGEGELVIDHDANGLLLPIVHGDFPGALQLALPSDDVGFVVVPFAVCGALESQGLVPRERLRVSEARFRAKRAFTHEVVFEIDAQPSTDQVELLPIHDVRHQVGLCIQFGCGLVRKFGGNLHRP